MKKVICLVFLLALTPPIRAAQVLTGHDWKTLSDNSRHMYMLAFIEGYLKGHWQGIVGEGGGAYSALRWVRDDLCPKKSESACARIGNVLGGKENIGMHGVSVIEFDNKIPYYIKELDAFYEAFPLCRGRSVNNILGKIVTTWASPKLTESSLVEIGSDCGK